MDCKIPGPVLRLPICPDPSFLLTHAVKRSGCTYASEGQTLPYYTKGMSRTKIMPSHVKIMIFRPLIWAVDGVYILKKSRGLADFHIYR